MFDLAFLITLSKLPIEAHLIHLFVRLLLLFAHFEGRLCHETLGWSRGARYFLCQMLRRWSLHPRLFVQLEGLIILLSCRHQSFKKLQCWKIISNEVSGRET